MHHVAALLPCGQRLHLQHGPIDLIIGCDGDRAEGFAAAEHRFETILQELVDELPELRAPVHANSNVPNSSTARRMHQAVLPMADEFVTQMAAVAGAVADEVLAAMLACTNPGRAYVNNGGDIALHLSVSQRFSLSMSNPCGLSLGQITVNGGSGIGGIATSGLGGRSLTMGIADSVTVLADNAAAADVAATLIANAVDVPGHAAIQRRPAIQVKDDCDLGARPVVVSCGSLSSADLELALEYGARKAERLLANGLIRGAALFLRGRYRTLGSHMFQLQNTEQGLKIA